MYFFGYVVIIQLLMAMVDLASKKDASRLDSGACLDGCIGLAHSIFC